MEVEITRISPLTAEQNNSIEMHSLLNMLNVLQGELALIGLELANDPDLLKRGLAVCAEVKRSFVDRAASLAFSARVGDAERALLAEIDAELASHPGSRENSELQESLGNIRAVFRILRLRAEEIIARARDPDKWVEFTIDELQGDFRGVFSAIEKNSHGRYRIIYNLARQGPTDYYIDFVIESANARTVGMPATFKDVIRDLAANARKYTKPGGTISLGLYEGTSELRFVVQDNGCGIPPDEIEQVVEYGRRGSNVLNRRTMGGGFGLTKAFVVTRRFGGRFWIKSELDVGTRITIVIPAPDAAAA